MIYWDTSALIKLYAPEPNSDIFLKHMKDIKTPPATADTTSSELLCALYRKEASGELTEGGAEVLFKRYLDDTTAGRIVLIPNGRDVTAAAQRLIHYAYSQPQPTQIRSVDVVHVASALVTNAKAMMATDVRLREVAGLMGLKVLPEGKN